MHHLTSNIELKRDAFGDTGAVEGYASTFGNIDSTHDRVERGAFAETLAKSMPKMLFNHDLHSPTAIPIGAWESAWEDEKGLYVKGRLFIDGDNFVPGAKAVYRGLKEGVIDKMSIGYRPLDYLYEGDVRVLTKVDLVEVSFVNLPANENAVVMGVKSQNVRGLEHDLRDVGISAKDAVKAISVFKKSHFWPCDTGEGIAETKEREAGEFLAALNKHLQG